MTAEDILNDLKKEESTFLKQFDDEKTFRKAFANPLQNMLEIKSNIAFDDTTWGIFFLLMAPLFSFFLSLIILLSFGNIHDGFLQFSLTAFFYTSSLLSIPQIVKHTLMRKKDRIGVIKKYLSKSFYKSPIKDEIHNSLKLYLTDEEYYSLRKDDQAITYKKAIDIIELNISKEKIAQEKKNISLTAEEIKKYSHNEYVSLN